MKAKVNPASQCWAVRIALGIEIWNFEDRVAVSVTIILLLDRCSKRKMPYRTNQGQ
jgi:hypothetical protein